jgi:hypothetical protein
VAQEALDRHYYKSVTYGLQYTTVLSISTIVHALEVLTTLDCCEENDQSNGFPLELHLRCVVSALKLLHLQGTNACARHLTFDFIERLQTALTRWATDHCRQAWGTGREQGKTFENYNNEFLIVYAKDLVARVSCDRDLTVHAVTHIAAGIPLSHLVFVPGDTNSIGQFVNRIAQICQD